MVAKQESVILFMGGKTVSESFLARSVLRIGWIERLLATFGCFMKPVSFLFFAGNRTAAGTQESRESINRQAEHMLLDYGNSILRLAYSYLHNTSDAEEILQDTLIQFLKATPDFESSEHEKAWLLRVAANLSKNRIAYNKIRTTEDLSDMLAEEGREDLSFVWEAVKNLPMKYREVIHLFYYEGYSTAQVADILKKNEATVRSHLHRGRAKLKKDIGGGI